MKSIAWSVFLALALTSCSCFWKCKAPSESDPENFTPINKPEISRMIGRAVKDLKKDWDLNLLNAEIIPGPYGDKIEMQFISQEILEIPEARALMVDIVSGVLDRINGNDELLFQVSPRPLPPSSLEICIDFESYFIKYVDPFYVRKLMLYENIVYFFDQNAFDDNTQMWHRRVEPYDRTALLVEIDAEGEPPLWERMQTKKDTFPSHLFK